MADNTDANRAYENHNDDSNQQPPQRRASLMDRVRDTVSHAAEFGAESVRDNYRHHVGCTSDEIPAHMTPKEAASRAVEILAKSVAESHIHHVGSPSEDSPGPRVKPLDDESKDQMMT